MNEREERVLYFSSKLFLILLICLLCVPGLSQGLRRAIVSVGTIMAPLWGSSASTKPGLLIGVLVALQGLSLVRMCNREAKKLDLELILYV